ncbi:hypothetical protein [Frondihabitans sp. 762G35]|nr:hypothetical protein [Frondihabitans sp. 762G35]
MTDSRPVDAPRRSLRPPTKDFPATQPWRWLYRWVVVPAANLVGWVLQWF